MISQFRFFDFCVNLNSNEYQIYSSADILIRCANNNNISAVHLPQFITNWPSRSYFQAGLRVQEGIDGHTSRGHNHQILRLSLKIYQLTSYIKLCFVAVLHSRNHKLCQICQSTLICHLIWIRILVPELVIMIDHRSLLTTLNSSGQHS